MYFREFESISQIVAINGSFQFIRRYVFPGKTSGIFKRSVFNLTKIHVIFGVFPPFWISQKSSNKKFCWSIIFCNNCQGEFV